MADGFVTLTILPTATFGEAATWFFAMKKGSPLAAQPGVETLRVSEFKFTPDAAPASTQAPSSENSNSTTTSSSVLPFNVDGEAMPAASEVHVKVLPRRLTVFAS
jgi:diacylglycerol kinase family enzyme